MTTYLHLVDTLKALSPMEVIEVCGFDEDSEGLVGALSDFIEDKMEDIEERLVENGLIDEED